jgi:hypothetical protein
MGSLIQIGGGADAEIKGSLNFAFNDLNIRQVRTVVKNENLFDDLHHLHRVAYRLGAYPVRNYGNDPAKAKWFFFLKYVLTAAMRRGVATSDSIKKILSYAMSNPNAVQRVVFDAIQGADLSPHYVEWGNPITDGNPTDPSQIRDLVDQTGTLLIRLICPRPLQDGDVAPTPNRNDDLDRDPEGNVIERPPIKIFTPAPAGAVRPKPPKKTKKARKVKARAQPKKRAKTRAKKGK